MPWMRFREHIQVTSQSNVQWSHVYCLLHVYKCHKCCSNKYLPRTAERLNTELANSIIHKSNSHLPLCCISWGNGEVMADQGWSPVCLAWFSPFAGWYSSYMYRQLYIQNLLSANVFQIVELHPYYQLLEL